MDSSTAKYGIAAALALPLALLLLVVGMGKPPTAALAGLSCDPVTAGQTLPDGTTLTDEQSANAATIVAVGERFEVPTLGLVIAIATAWVESRLVNVDYGDRDSLGLFQQRPSQGWGTPAQVQEPLWAATQFYTRLVRIPGWDTDMTPGEAAQAVQRSAFPDRYDESMPTAVAVYTGLAETTNGTIDGLCAPTATIGEITPTGNLATVTTHSGGTITVDASLAQPLAALLNAAAADGIRFDGWGWRSNERQIELRRSHCGSSHYAIWEKPSSQCSPPTARPGASQHERGLAVDFTEHGSTLTRRSSGYQWLTANAARYGLYNLPSEPWHWSVTGT